MKNFKEKRAGILEKSLHQTQVLVSTETINNGKMHENHKAHKMYLVPHTFHLKVKLAKLQFRVQEKEDKGQR